MIDNAGPNVLKSNLGNFGPPLRTPLWTGREAKLKVKNTLNIPLNAMKVDWIPAENATGRYEELDIKFL